MFDDFYDNFSEYGYLIEMGDPISPEYLSIGSLPYCFWSKDTDKAMRFCRAIDAEKFLFVLSWYGPTWNNPRIVQHCFVVENIDSVKM